MACEAFRWKRTMKSAEKTFGCTNVRHASADRNACPALSEPPKHVTDAKILMS
jgi:hypothetical protein